MALVRILIADDHELVRQGLRTLLASRPSWEICGEAADGREAIEKAAQLKPDIVLLDVSMPRLNGLEAAAIIKRESPASEILIVSQHAPAEILPSALKVGARGFVSKSEVARNLLSTIESIVAPAPQLAPGVNGGEPAPAAFLAGDTETAAIIRSVNWSATPLGPLERWSPTLRMMTRLLLANRSPLLLWWGAEFCGLYNDACRPILGSRHPHAMGQPARQCWSELWPVLRPLIETPYRGGPSTSMEDFSLEGSGHGFTEETHFTFAYSPVPDETAPAGIGGVLATVQEITGQVITERRNTVLRELAARSAPPGTAEDACAIATSTIARHASDIPFALLYLIDATRTQAVLAGAAGVDVAREGVLRSIPLGSSDTIWPLRRIMDSGEAQLLEHIGSRIVSRASGSGRSPLPRAALLPIRSNLPRRFAGFLVAGLSPRLRLDAGYRSFLELVSAHIATTIASARACGDELRRAVPDGEEPLQRPLSTARLEDLLLEQNYLLELIARGRPLDECLHAITESVTHLQPDARAGVVMGNEARTHIERVVASRLPSGFGAALEGIALDDQPMGAAMQRGEPVTCADLAGGGKWSDPWRMLYSAHGVRGVHCTPIWGTDGSAVASFFICYCEAREPSAWERDLARFGAHAGSLAIERASVRGSEQRFRTLFESIDEGFCVIEKVKGPPGAALDFRYLQANPGFTVHTGVDNVVGRTIREVFAGESQEGFLAYDTILATGESRQFERELPAQGRVLDMYAFRVEDGTHSRIAVICKDITDRKHTEAFMLCQKDAFEKAASGMALTDVLGFLAQCMERHLGDQPRVAIHLLDASGTRFAQVAAPSLPCAYRDELAAAEMSSSADPCCVAVARGERLSVMDAPTSREYPHYAAFSSRHGIRSGCFLPIVSSKGRPLGAFACHYSTTRQPHARESLLGGIMTRTASIIIERKQAELLLRQRSTQFEILVNQAPLGIVLVDAQLRIRQVNPIARPMFGSIADVVGRDFDEVVHILWEKEYADEIMQVFRHTLQTGESYHTPERIEPRLDRKITEYYEWRTDRIPLSEGGYGVVCYFRDIAAEVQARVALQEARDNLESRVRERTEELERAYKSLRVLSVRMMQMQDEDRRRIARDLHDSAGQLLAALGMELASLNLRAAALSPELVNDLNSSHQLVQQLTQEIRTASYLLHPPLLDDAGLSGALRWYVAGLSKRSGIAITLELDEQLGRLPRELEAAVFHIVQESLMNIHRHSGSKTAALRIARSDREILLEIEDEGVGIAPDKLHEIQTQGSGVGIAGMRERVLHFNGEMRITSVSTGTRIVVTFPTPRDGAAGSHREPALPPQAPRRLNS